MYQGNSSSREKGFTLVELMITVLVAAILLAIAAPGFRNLLERNRLQSAASNLYASLMLARSEALKRNQSVGVCQGTASTSAASCTNTVDGAWEGGWLIHIDPTNPSSLDPNDVIATRLALKSGDTLRVAQDPNDSSSLLNAITFRPDGGASTAAVFILCNADGDLATARVVELGVTGRPRIFQSFSTCSP